MNLKTLIIPTHGPVMSRGVIAGLVAVKSMTSLFVGGLFSLTK